MNKLTYNINSEHTPITVRLTGVGYDVTQTHQDNGEYFFDDLYYGQYEINITDSEDCQRNEIVNIVDESTTISCNVSCNIYTINAGEIRINNVMLYNFNHQGNKFIIRVVDNLSNEIVFTQSYSSFNNEIIIGGLDGGEYLVVFQDLTSVNENVLKTCTVKKTIQIDEIIPCTTQINFYEGCSNIIDERKKFIINKLFLSSYTDNTTPKFAELEIYEVVNGNETLIDSFNMVDDRYVGISVNSVDFYISVNTYEIGDQIRLYVNDPTSTNNCIKTFNITITDDVQCTTN